MGTTRNLEINSYFTIHISFSNKYFISKNLIYLWSYWIFNANNTNASQIR